MIKVKSSNLHAVGYNKEESILYIQFKNKITYKYEDVPEMVYNELMKSSSKGSYLYHNIRDKYKTYKI